MTAGGDGGFFYYIGGWPPCDVCIGPVLCAAAVMNDVVVMDIHQHSDRLANDEGDPHGGISIDSI